MMTATAAAAAKINFTCIFNSGKSSSSVGPCGRSDKRRKVVNYNSIIVTNPSAALRVANITITIFVNFP